MTSTDPNLADRDIRQRDLVPPAELARCHAVVIGVGSIGRQVALQLAATGVPVMTLYDPDTVAPENLAPQGYWETDVGDPKVHAAANICHQQFPRMELHARQERFRRSASRGWPADRVAAVFCCVDAIATRKLIWDAVRTAVGFFADGRMAAEVVRVLASGEPAVDKTYPATLFASGDAYVGSCTSKSTIYAASVAAGLMVGQFARWLRGQPVIPDQMLNLLAAELSVSDPVA
jgi:molybdopterin/thiamine biosynthesis adenylyltransferase